MPDPLDKIITSLGRTAEQNIARAWDVLGCLPGPGIDIQFIPTDPISVAYTFRPLTPAGKAFLERLYPYKIKTETVKELVDLKRSLLDWGLSFEVDWSVALEAKVDP